ncbi:MULTISPECIES: flagellar assembly protein FliX [unclassified Iodidimonas]|jgi:hypothetical protein|uniref:flagellar assembly protein FliX n=1 Tax=unclassified Iodidimonas TaxID=2626145 RepID=UPI002482D438|nr:MULTISPECIES: flagellar assembly protein FliX [unclassified Iodidimonas]
MRIDGPGKSNSLKSSQKASKSSGAGGAAFSASIDGGRAASSSTPAAASGPIASVDALLALQEMPDASAGRSKGLARAHDMLDMLEDVRKGLLMGAIPQSKLSQLSRLARDQRDGTLDPALSAILDDIEVRAEVELAKLEQES